MSDFDSGANALWTLYENKAKSHDEARIQTLKDDMNGILLFVRPYLLCSYDGLSHTDESLHRPVYFPLPSHRSWLIANRTWKLTQQTRWFTTYNNIPPSFLRSPNKSRPLPHRSPSRLLRLPLSLLFTHQRPISV
jgi:hypothetical protein